MNQSFLVKKLVLMAVFLCTLVGNITAQSVTGVITDANTGQTLPGVNIVIKGTNLGTSSDVNGEYRMLNVPSLEESVLIFSFIGYETVEIPINNRTQVNVELSQAALLFDDELTVVAYGVQRKSDITGSIASVSSEDLNQGNVVNPGQMLQGLVAGVNITSASGEPGAAQDVIIRGVGSLRSGTQPLYVIDGFALDNNSTGGALNYINPQDIQSIEVLKDASATALYGARASNGVVVITTKNGTRGQSTLSISTSTSLSTISNKIDVFTADEFRSAVVQAGGTLDDLGGNTDWQDALTQTAVSSDYNVSMGGAASQNFNYFASFGVQDQEGILNESNLKRYSGRLNLTQTELDGRLTIDYRLSAVRTENLRPDNGSIVIDMLQLNPTVPVFTDGGLTQLDNTYTQFDNKLNPLQRNELYMDEIVNNRLFANVASTLEVFKGLNYQLKVGVDFSENDRLVQFKPYGLLEGYEEGRLSTSQARNVNTLIENTLTYRLDTDKHSVTTLLGHTYQKFDSEGRSLSMEGFADNGVEPRYQDQSSTSINPTSMSSAAEVNKLLSFFFRTNYSYDSKYLFTATLRADGSSKFGDNNEFGYFPSVALGWNVSNESFFTSDLINNLKVRTSWGQTGNQDIPSKITQLSYTESRDGTNTYPLGGDEQTLDDFPFGTVFTRLYNPNIQWEVSTQVNLGVDFELLDSRLVGSVDFFNKTSENILLEVTPSDPIQPTSTFWTNIPNMEIQNSGIELALEYRSKISNDFQYTIGGNFSTNNNEVANSPFNVLTTGGASGAGQTGATINGYINGEPIGAFYMYEFAGIGPDGLNQFADRNGDGAVLEDDRYVAGSALPEYLFGIQLSMDYKDFNLSMNFNGAGGHQIYNHTTMSLFSKGSLASSNNTTAFATQYNEEDPTNSNTVSTRYLEDGDYFRLNNATLSYRLRPETIGLAGAFRSLNLFVTGQNLFVITDYSGFDPEVNTNASVNGIQSFGIDRFTYPKARTILFGINLSL